jgi:hypothetical protein
LLRWSFAGRDRQALVRTEEIGPPVVIAGRILETQITLRASDDRAYSANATVTTIQRGQSAVVPNGGTVETPPLIRVIGPLEFPRVRSEGRTLHITKAITSGSLILDAQARTIRDALGASRPEFFNFVRSRWFMIPPGGAIVAESNAPSGTGRIEVTTWDAYQ